MQVFEAKVCFADAVNPDGSNTRTKAEDHQGGPATAGHACSTGLLAAAVAEKAQVIRYGLPLL